MSILFTRFMEAALTGVAVRRARGRVSPAPVSVQDNRVLVGRAGAARRASAGRQLRVGLGGESAGLLGESHGEEREGVESCGVEHCC